MSDDAKAAKELVETLKTASGASPTQPRSSATASTPSGPRSCRGSRTSAGFWREIVEMGHDYGEDVDESGSVAAAVHRGWIALKDAVSGDDAEAVLKAAVPGEDHAVSEYEDAVEADLSAGFREVVVRQQAAVVAARDEIKALQDVS